MRASLALLTVLLAVPAVAQLVPGVSLPQMPVAGPVTQSVEQTLQRPLGSIGQSAESLVQARAE